MKQSTTHKALEILRETLNQQFESSFPLWVSADPKWTTMLESIEAAIVAEGESK